MATEFTNFQQYTVYSNAYATCGSLTAQDLGDVNATVFTVVLRGVKSSTHTTGLNILYYLNFPVYIIVHTFFSINTIYL